ncbi:MAG: HD domain-containing protein [Pirellulales bacterium]
MSTLRDLPEVVGLDARESLVRIPPELDVPLTPRVRRILDTAEFHRLAGVSQLGLVALVYPAANHTRFEHSLGVYRLALLYLKQLSYDERFRAAVSVADAELFLAAALVHDIGHWPFCHPIEDIHLPGVPRHEDFARRYLVEGELAGLLQTDWGVAPERIVELLGGQGRRPVDRVLASLLSSPIDIDKMDYLSRDSLHAGVPYGRHFDQQRLIGSLCLNEAGDALAISDKGRTAAEMMVFARYVMFSEVYWHHAVRSATAMLQRAFYLLRERLDFDALFPLGETEFVAQLHAAARGTQAAGLLDGLFGPQRRLHKRLAQFSYLEDRALYERLARRPYSWLVRASEELARLVGARLGQPIDASELLFDAPPVEREVEFNIEIYFAKEDRYRPFVEVSPIVRTFENARFDDYVKRVRVFAAAEIVGEVRALGDIRPLVERAIELAG